MSPGVGVDDTAARWCKGKFAAGMDTDNALSIPTEVNGYNIFEFAGFHIGSGYRFDVFGVCIQGHDVIGKCAHILIVEVQGFFEFLKYAPGSFIRKHQLYQGVLHAGGRSRYSVREFPDLIVDNQTVKFGISV
jgi:hypothetical protein